MKTKCISFGKPYCLLSVLLLNKQSKVFFNKTVQIRKNFSLCENLSLIHHVLFAYALSRITFFWTETQFFYKHLRIIGFFFIVRSKIWHYHILMTFKGNISEYGWRWILPRLLLCLFLYFYSVAFIFSKVNIPELEFFDIC